MNIKKDIILIISHYIMNHVILHVKLVTKVEVKHNIIVLCDIGEVFL